jgi:hypothetical protein
MIGVNAGDRDRPRTSGARERIIWAIGIYLVATACFVLAMPRSRLWQHSPYNHYALQAAAWLDGRLDLGGPPPSYTGYNDFAVHGDEVFVSFPPVPALLLVPAVAWSGSAEAVRDVQLWLWLAGIGPMLFFLALERLRDSRQLARTRRENALLSLLLAIGTVYWFSAVQGSVWFAGHVVGMALSCGYLLASADCRHPALAGLCLALAFGTRPTLGFALPFFVFEWWRAGRRPRAALAFVAPAAVVLSLLAWHNHARFGDPFEFGHRLLAVRWRDRIDAFGLFSLHYLGKNLAVAMTSLPFFTREGLQINGHGLALWITSPIYLWALWPKRPLRLFWVIAVSAACVALPSLFYQNTGWIQFGYRFSNDYAPLLVMMIALGGRSLGVPFYLLAAWSIAVNGVGAVTFDNPSYSRLYFIDPTQRIVHQAD